MTEDFTPVLDCRDDGNLDYTDATFKAKNVTVHNGKLSLSWALEGAPTLKALINAGHARYAMEVRETVTLRSELHIADIGSSHLASRPLFADNETPQHPVVGIPGIIAVKDLNLRRSDLHPELWSDESETIPIPAGRWLARGQHQHLNDPLALYCSFFANPDMPNTVSDVHDPQPA